MDKFFAYTRLPDTAHLLFRLVTQVRPRYILEFGSGISTVIMAKAAKLFKGYVYSLEHQEEWLAKTQELCKLSGAQSNNFGRNLDLAINTSRNQ